MLHRIPGVIRRLGTAAALNAGTAPFNAVQLDSAGKLPAVDGSNLTGISGSSVIAGLISGLVLGYATATTFTIASGLATDSAASVTMKLLSTITKSLSAWAAGNGNGALDTGTVAANSWYHVFLIERSDTGGIDGLISLSPTAPTMPTNYDKKRRIGSIKTDASSNLVKWFQDGSTFIWDVQKNDYGAVPGVTTAFTISLSVPNGVRVQALISVGVIAHATTTNYILTDLQQTDTTPTGLVRTTFASANNRIGFPMSIFTSTAGQIRARCDQTDAELYVNTVGWIDQL